MSKINLELTRREALDLHNLILGELLFSSGIWKKKLDKIKKQLEEQLFTWKKVKMKLRNKKTGEIGELRLANQEIYVDTNRNMTHCYKTIAGLNAEWEEYRPIKPLIKDEKIRKAVRAWAEANNYKKCVIYVSDYDKGGVYLEEGVTSFVSCESHLSITFFGIGIDIKSGEQYTIAELCGEEE